MEAFPKNQSLSSITLRNEQQDYSHDWRFVYWTTLSNCMNAHCYMYMCVCSNHRHWYIQYHWMNLKCQNTQIKKKKKGSVCSVFTHQLFCEPYIACQIQFDLLMNVFGGPNLTGWQLLTNPFSISPSLVWVETKYNSSQVKIRAGRLLTSYYHSQNRLIWRRSIIHYHSITL